MKKSMRIKLSQHRNILTEWIKFWNLANFYLTFCLSSYFWLYCFFICKLRIIKLIFQGCIGHYMKWCWGWTWNKAWLLYPKWMSVLWGEKIYGTSEPIHCLFHPGLCLSLWFCCFINYWTSWAAVKD